MSEVNINYYDDILKLTRLANKIKTENVSIEILRVELLQYIFSNTTCKEFFINKVNYFFSIYKTLKYKNKCKKLYQKCINAAQLEQNTEWEQLYDKPIIFFHPSLYKPLKSDPDFWAGFQVQNGIIGFYAEISPLYDEILFFDKDFDKYNIEYFILFESPFCGSAVNDLEYLSRKSFTLSAYIKVINDLIRILQIKINNEYFNSKYNKQEAENIITQLDKKNLIPLCKAIRMTSNEQKMSLLDKNISYGKRSILDSEDKLRHCCETICNIFDENSKPKTYRKAFEYLNQSYINIP